MISDCGIADDASDRLPDRAPAGLLRAASRPRARRVLMVLYFFPPLGGVSMSRNIRNAQYLPQYGWLPVVLTPREGGFELKDAGALDLVDPALEVLRTRSWEAGHLRPAAVAVRDRLRRYLPRQGSLAGRRYDSLSSLITPREAGAAGADATRASALGRLR